MPSTIDFAALTDPLPAGQTPRFVPIPRTVSRSRVLTGLALLFLGLITAFGGIGGTAGVLRNASSGLTAYANVIAPLAIVVASVVLIAIGVKLMRRESGRRESMAPRLEAFAAANGLLYSDSTPNPSYPGSIFTLDNLVDRVTLRHMRSTTGRFFDVGEFVARVDMDSSAPIMRNWGFIAISLDRRLPHMMLRSKLDGRHSTALPDDLRDQQTLSLEGDFDAWFTLHAPEQYERDALYVFTPDLMALLIDNAAPFDVEIVDDWMFVYSATPFPSAHPGVYQRLFQIVDTVGAKTLAQTDRYVDEKVGSFAANFVAPQGQRLKRGWSVGAVITIAAFLLIWGLPQLIGFFSVFAR